MLSPSSSSCVATAQLHEEGDNSCRRLLLPAMQLRWSAPEEGESIVELRCNTVCRFLLPLLMLRCSVVSQRRRRHVPSPFSFVLLIIIFPCSIARKATTLY